MVLVPATAPSAAAPAGGPPGLRLWGRTKMVGAAGAAVAGIETPQMMASAAPATDAIRTIELFPVGVPRPDANDPLPLIEPSRPPQALQSEPWPCPK